MVPIAFSCKMATPVSAEVSGKPTAVSSSANELARSPTLQKLELLAVAKARHALSQKPPKVGGTTTAGEELLRILGRQRVRVDQNAIHFVSEPAERRSSVIRSTLTKDKLICGKGGNIVKKRAEELAQDGPKDESTEKTSSGRRESVFRMAPAAAGRTIIARRGAPPAECITSEILKYNCLIMRRFTVEGSTGHSEDEQEDWGGEEDAVGAAALTGNKDEETQTKKTPGYDILANMPEESKATVEQKELLLTTVAAALHAEIEEALTEGKEAVVTTEPYNADEPADITLAVTRIRDMAEAVERLTGKRKEAAQSCTQASPSTDASDTTTQEQSEHGSSEVVLTEADFNVLESLQQAYIRSNLVLWLDQMKTIYRHGVRLLRVNVLGKMFIRIVTIQDGCIQLVPVNAQAKSNRTVALTVVETVKLGKHSREFRALKERIAAGEEAAEADPPATACAVIFLTRNRTVSLLFMDELQRNGFVFALRVWSMWAKAALRELEWEA